MFMDEIVNKLNVNNILMECRNIEKSFTLKGKIIPVFKDLNLSIGKGEISVVTGRSGAGKSTLLGLLGGLDKQTSGSIIFKNQKLEDLSNEELTLLRRNSIGIICQNFNLIPSWTAIENIEAALLHSGISKVERMEKVKKILTVLELGELLYNLPAELSIGQQQRVAVARAIVNDPELILCDEPTGEVESETACDIIKIMFGLVEEKGVTLFVVTKEDFLINVLQSISRLGNDMYDRIKNIFRIENYTLSHVGSLKDSKERLLRGDFYEGCI